MLLTMGINWRAPRGGFCRHLPITKRPLNNNDTSIRALIAPLCAVKMSRKFNTLNAFSSCLYSYALPADVIKKLLSETKTLNNKIKINLCKKHLTQ